MALWNTWRRKLPALFGPLAAGQPAARRARFLAATALVLLLVIVARCPRGGGRPLAETEVVSRQLLEERIPATGTIHPAVEVRLAPEVSGEIVEICCKEGDTVAEGDIVVRIRQDQYQSQVEQARASLGSLRAQYRRQKAELQQARSDYERDRRLFDLQAISAAEWQASQTAFDIARSGLQSAGYAVQSGEAQLKEALENLKKTTVYAPMDGIVSRMNVEKGERVVGTSQMAGTELCRIADFSRMEIEVSVGENDVVRIAPQDSVEIEVDAHPHRLFRGVVTQIANSAQFLDGRFDQVRNFGVRIEILPDSARFLPGMSASVSIIAGRSPDCIAVPLASVRTEGRDTYVWTVDDDGTLHRRSVTTGIQDMDRMEIRSGLEPGDRLVTGPADLLAEGIAEGKKVKY